MPRRNLKTMSIGELSKIASKKKVKNNSRFIRVKERRVNIVKELVEKGEKSLKTYCDRTNLTPYGIYNICKENNIQLPSDIIPYGHIKKINDLVPHGLTRNQIAIKLGKFHSQISFYFQVTYLGKELDEERRYQKSFNHPKRLSRILNQIGYDMAKQRGWAEAKAWEVHRQTVEKPGCREISLEKLIELFRRRELAELKGEPRTYREFGKDLFDHPIQVGRIFEIANLKPMYGRGKKKLYFK